MDTKEQTTAVKVAEEEYQAELARGLAEDEVLHPGQHVFKRGGFLARHGLTPDHRDPPVKVHISVDLDQGVFS